MQFGDALCYALLAITMAATCIRAEIEPDEGERNLDRRSSRRVSTLFADGSHIESMIRNPSKVIYKRLSRKRHAPPKSSYGPPRSKYGSRPVKLPARKPESKWRGKLNTKHSRPTHQTKRSPKPRYGPPKLKHKPIYGPPKQKRKPTYGPPKINIHRPYTQSDSSSFAEPPPNFPYKHRPNNNAYIQDNFNDESPNEGYEKFNGDFTIKPNARPEFSSPGNYYFQDKPFDDSFPLKPQFNDYQNPKQDYGEPPVDSYGAPIKPNLRDLTFPTAQSLLDATSHLYNHNPEPDSAPNYTKKHLKFSQPEDIFVTPLPEDQSEELDLNSYSDIYNYREAKNKIKKNKGSYYENIKMVNRPWKSKVKDDEEDIIVGGQYAEPPARYVPNFHPSAPMHIREHDHSNGSPTIIYADPDAMSSATISSYVNYKNSNMAFSPQNLNDVFSIVDK